MTDNVKNINIKIVKNIIKIDSEIINAPRNAPISHAHEKERITQN